MPLPAEPAVTVGHRADLDVLVAAPPDRSAATWLRLAGFVRDDALDLYRPGRDTPAPVAERQLQDATTWLNSRGYGVTRIYSDTEQQRRIRARAEGPSRTAPGCTTRIDRLTADLRDGHLVLLAHHQSPYLSRFLARYTADDATVIGSTEDLRFYDLSGFPDPAAASRAWSALGHSFCVPVLGQRRAGQAATRASPSQPASSVVVPWPEAGQMSARTGRHEPPAVGPGRRRP